MNQDIIEAAVEAATDPLFEWIYELEGQLYEAEKMIQQLDDLIGYMESDA